MSWLTMVSLPGTRVIGGRHSHSVLDLHRIVDSGIPVLIPVRDPVDACASMMTRSGEHDSLRQGRGLLRAYAAWYSVTGRLLGRPGVRAAPFSVITARPEDLIRGHPWSDAVDSTRARDMQMDEVVEHTRQALASVVGQGLPEAGVPAHLMISVPDPAREAELDRARQVLRAPTLEADRSRAQRAHEDFVSGAGTRR